MKHVVLLFLFLALGAQCKKENASPTPTVNFSCAEQPAVCELTGANGHFAIDIFKKINSQEPAAKNIFISPFSISTALTMTANGAAGQTLNDMRQTLRIAGLSPEAVNTSYKTLLQTLPQLDAHTKLKLANSIWYQNSFPVQPPFLNTSTEYFQSELFPVNFKEPAVLGQVNDWIENRTDGLIPDALNELDPATAMLLINAIYFKGAWKTKFDPEDTFSAPFYGPNGAQQVDMMHLGANNFPYFSTPLFQAIDLPYGDSTFSMSIFLPAEGHDVNEVIAALTPGTWNQWLASFQSQPVELLLPKFKMKYDIKLKRSLSDLGMGLAFSDAADFSNMIAGGGVTIDDVIHKSFVEVNEAGTEAAAVTVVVVVVTSMPTTPVVNVNRPFLFVIRDNKTNSILFMGKMMQPEA